MEPINLLTVEKKKGYARAKIGNGVNKMNKTLMRETSLKAYNMIQAKLNRRESQVLAIFNVDPNRSWTNYELSKALGWAINRVTGRTNSLVNKGILVYAEHRLNADTNALNMAWRLKSIYKSTNWGKMK